MSEAFSDRMKLLMGEDWFNLLSGEFSKDYMRNLSVFIDKRRSQTTVYPNKDEVFTTYRVTPYNTIRVCILGQDPYLNPFEAHGIAFSTFNGQYTPSLKQIESAVRRDCNYPIEYKWSNNLERWCKQGVFLLNTILTVDKGVSNSHANMGWEQFTLQTIRELDKKGIIFLLWGNNAKAYTNHIKNSTVISSEHPQAANYTGRIWDNKECFKKVNELLNDKINW